MKSPFHRSVLALGGHWPGCRREPRQRASSHRSRNGAAQEIRIRPPRSSGPIRRMTGFLATKNEAQKGFWRRRRVRRPVHRMRNSPRSSRRSSCRAGFKIEVWASGRAGRAARWPGGDKGTLFRRLLRSRQCPIAITDKDGKEGRQDRPEGSEHADRPSPSRTARLLRHRRVDKLIKYENAEANLDKLGDGKVVYDDMPVLCRPWLEIYRGRQGRLVLHSVRDRPSTSAFRRPASRRIRRVDPKTGNAEKFYALGRPANSVGGDRRSSHRQILVHGKNARRLDQRRSALGQAQTSSTRWASISAIPIATRATCRIRSFAMGHKWLGVHPAGPIISVAHMAPARP